MGAWDGLISSRLTNTITSTCLCLSRGHEEDEVPTWPEALIHALTLVKTFPEDGEIFTELEVLIYVGSLNIEYNVLSIYFKVFYVISQINISNLDFFH